MSDRQQREGARPPFPPLVESQFERDGYTVFRTERAPFDFRGGPWDNYGQSGTRLQFAVSNGRGAMSVSIHLRDYVNDPHGPGVTAGPLGWHYPPSDPRAADGELGKCEYLDGGECCAAVGYIAGEQAELEYVHGGEDDVIAWLSAHCGAEFPDA